MFLKSLAYYSISGNGDNVFVLVVILEMFLNVSLFFRTPNLNVPDGTLKSIRVSSNWGIR